MRMKAENVNNTNPSFVGEAKYRDLKNKIVLSGEKHRNGQEVVF